MYISFNLFTLFPFDHCCLSFKYNLQDTNNGKSFYPGRRKWGNFVIGIFHLCLIVELWHLASQSFYADKLYHDKAQLYLKIGEISHFQKCPTHKGVPLSSTNNNCLITLVVLFVTEFECYLFLWHCYNMSFLERKFLRLLFFLYFVKRISFFFQ